MNSFFSYEGRFSQILFRFAYACILGAFWLVSSIPIVTIGAATTALYSVTLKIAEAEEGNIVKQYWRAFRGNFKQSTLTWLILFAIGLFLGADTYVLLHLRSTSAGALAVMWTIVLAIVVVAIIVYIVELMYVFPLISRFENTIRSMMVNSLLIGARYLLCTILVFAIHFAMFVVVVRFFTPAILFSEGICALLSSYLFSPVFRLVAQIQGNLAKDADGHDAEEEQAR